VTNVMQRIPHWLYHLWRLAMAGAVLLTSQMAIAADHAVILMYHRFGEDAIPSTNIRLEQFDRHLEILTNGGYTVWPLGKIVTHMQTNQPLPDRTVGISVDDAYLSVYTEAWPRLKEKGLPFTLFVATDPVDRDQRGYMSWAQIRELQNAGVEIGSQTASHPHMYRLDAAENAAELAKSNDRFLAEIGIRPRLFAYPYGEYSLAVMAAVKAAGFTAAFGQNSGVAHGYDGFFELPRFAMNEQYGTEERLRLAINGLPLKVSQILPEDVLIDQNPPAFGFTLAPDLTEAQQLNCFNTTYNSLDITRFGQRVEVRFPGPLPAGRARVNCTMPATDGRWRWFGKQFLVP